jgi:hypothetical protein
MCSSRMSESPKKTLKAPKIYFKKFRIYLKKLILQNIGWPKIIYLYYNKVGSDRDVRRLMVHYKNIEKIIKYWFVGSD